MQAPITIDQLDQHTAAYAKTRNDLAADISLLNYEIETLKLTHMPRIRRLAQQMQQHYARTVAAVELAPGLFEQRRTIVLHGIKVGYQKGRGSLEIPDKDRTVDLLIKHLGEEEAQQYLIVSKKPDKKALAKLNTATLRKVAVDVTETGDQVIVKPVDGDVEKAVDALLSAAAHEEADAEAEVA